MKLLKKSKSKRGEPSENFATAVGMKRHAKKMADGGEVKKPEPKPAPIVLDEEKQKKAQEGMRKAFHFASGGKVSSLADSIMRKRKMAEGGEVEPLEVEEIEDPDMLEIEPMDEESKDLMDAIRKRRKARKAE